MPGTNTGDGIARSSRILAHPLRVRILEAYAGAGDELSPTALADLLGAPLGNVSYHVRQLVGEGALELVKTEPVRGTLEHFYRATALGAMLIRPRYICPVCSRSYPHPGHCNRPGSGHEPAPTLNGPYVLAA